MKIWERVVDARNDYDVMHPDALALGISNFDKTNRVIFNNLGFLRNPFWRHSYTKRLRIVNPQLNQTAAKNIGLCNNRIKTVND
jgi:hypothetical protein